MKWTIKAISILVVFLSVVGAVSAVEGPVWPVKVGDNGRYFVDQQGRPVFWMGTTQWQLFREYAVEDARTILERTADKGFVFAQVMLAGVGDGTKANVYGDKPWLDDDPLTPNEAYFKNVDAVLQIARENNVNISMMLFHQRYRKHITVDNARQLGRRPVGPGDMHPLSRMQRESHSSLCDKGYSNTPRIHRSHVVATPHQPARVLPENVPDTASSEGQRPRQISS